MTVKVTVKVTVSKNNSKEEKQVFHLQNQQNNQNQLSMTLEEEAAAVTI